MLTSTTAPGKQFTSRSELAEHYKSDWHKYNLKRREAGLPLLKEDEFQTRWEAALALRKEKESKSHSGTDHLKKNSSSASKKKNKNKNKNKKDINNRQSKVQQGGDDNKMKISGNLGSGDVVDAGAAEEDTKEIQQQQEQQQQHYLAASQEKPVIDPKQCLFDSHISKSLEENVQYMQDKYGFFIPDRECLRDLNGLLGYCHEKIKLGHYCLFCEKVFPTWQGCQKHMIDKSHTKLRYEQGYGWEEMDPFYDFDKDNSNFLLIGAKSTTEASAAGGVVVDGGDTTMQQQEGDENMEEDEDGGWEDMSDDDGGDEAMDVGSDGEDVDDDDEALYAAYEKEIARFGLDVTPLGELVFPDGRIVGHRALRKYYKQRARPESSSTAIVAAKDAAGERLYQGRVVNIGHGLAGMKGGSAAAAGNGILVSSKDGGGFSSLSLYRFRAAVQKQRRDDAKGRRLQQRTTQNINRMDKKANRLMNGVSVAHAAR